MKAGFDNFDRVLFRCQVEGVVGDSGQAVVNKNLGIFGVTGDGQKTGTVERELRQVGPIALGELDGESRPAGEKEADQEGDEETGAFDGGGHSCLLYQFPSQPDLQIPP